MLTLLRPDIHRRSDSGSAMILTLMVMALVTALATTVSVVTINNLQSSARAQQAGSALNAADAGLAQAMTYLRTEGVRGLSCSPTCPANPWGNSTSPATVPVLGEAGQSYRVWIEALAPFPANNPGRYRIHSLGRAAGSASRTVTADIGVTSSNIPQGIFAREIDGGGSASVQRQSIFSAGCVYDREKIQMSTTDIDLAYGIPIGVHSARTITESNGANKNCSAGNGDIHAAGPCNSKYPYDQDVRGGSLLGTTCANTQTQTTPYPTSTYYGARDLDGAPGNEVIGSYIKDEASLLKLFGFNNPPGLSDSQLDLLRATAQAQGNYSNTAAMPSPNEVNAVMFFELTGVNLGKTVNLNNISGFGRDAAMSDDAACSTRSLTIVIVDGNAEMNANLSLAASLFLISDNPDYGQLTRGNGTADFIGTIFANKVNLIGNINLSTDLCFRANISPALLDFSSTSYRELDRGLL